MRETLNDIVSHHQNVERIATNEMHEAFQCGTMKKNERSNNFLCSLFFSKNVTNKEGTFQYKKFLFLLLFESFVSVFDKSEFFIR
jgi:hypothetical protein